MEISDLIGYIIKNYRKKDDLSKARLNKIIYLIDWKSSLDRGKQVTDIEWFFNNYGPYVSKIENIIRNDSRFKIKTVQNYYGNEKNLIKIVEDNFNIPSIDEKKIIDFVINVTEKLSWSNFINAVYSTYPLKTSKKGSILDLVSLAKKYKH